VVYPNSTKPGKLIVQSDRAIGVFNPKTGDGLLNWRGSNPKYFVHLDKSMGAEPYHFPDVFVAACMIAQPEPGQLIGSSPETGPVYIT
jgi:hypothetical protein